MGERMTTFYDQWLNARHEIENELENSGFVARDRDIPWVSTSKTRDVN